MRNAIARIWLPALVAIIGCGAAPEPAARGPKVQNVIIVLVDTLRADHIGTYGYERQTSPYLDEFAAGAVVFEHARSQSSCTFPSVNSLMTSRYPDVFARQGPGQFGIPDKYPAIAEILNNNGYHTVAVSASAIVRDTPSKRNPNGGFGRGFDQFIEGCVWRHGACVNRKIFQALKTLEEPFFLYLHYMEPHARYQPHPRYEKKFAGPYDGFDFIEQGNPKPISKMLYADGPKVEITDRDIQHLVDLYDDEIRYFDDVFRRLFGRLEALGQLDETIIVFASDHGEEFLEHGHINHCRGVWNTVTHVPLFLKIPGVDGRRLEVAVQNLDIVPTILDYLAINGEDFGFEGKSLRPFIERRAESSRFAFSRQTGVYSADDGRFHLILDASSDRFTLFDIGKDPLEQSDLFDPAHPEFGPLKSALDGWLEQTSKRMHLRDSIAADRAKEEELRALGYLE